MIKIKLDGTVLSLVDGGPFDGTSLTIKILEDGRLQLSAGEVSSTRDSCGGPNEVVVHHTIRPVCMTLEQLVAKLCG